LSWPKTRPDSKPLRFKIDTNAGHKKIIVIVVRSRAHRFNAAMIPCFAVKTPGGSLRARFLSRKKIPLNFNFFAARFDSARFGNYSVALR